LSIGVRRREAEGLIVLVIGDVAQCGNDPSAAMATPGDLVVRAG
jgi:hypothetical protein